MGEKFTNTYIGGLNRDAGKNRFPANQYWDAQNIRVLTDAGLTTGNLSGESGMVLSAMFPTTLSKVVRFRVTNWTGSHAVTLNSTTYAFSGLTTHTQMAAGMRVFFHTQITQGLFNIFDNIDSVVVVGLDDLHYTVGGSMTEIIEVPAQSDFRYVGSTTIRDQVILFTKSTTAGQIWKIRVNPVTGIPISTVANRLVPSEHLLYNGNLNFSLDHRVLARGYYETPEVQKVYFTDHYNVLRHFNTADPNGLGTPLNRLEITPDTRFSRIQIKDVVSGGQYKVGMVQYSYVLYNLHGAQSPFAPPSELVHIAPDDERLVDTQNYLGGPQGSTANKAIRVLLDQLDQRFTHIKVVSLYFETVDATPEIKIVYEAAVPSTGIINILDTGTSLGIVTLNEFNTLGTLNFKCSTMEIKDNMLFPANIVEEFYDVDYDARAYRFDSGHHAKIYSSDGTVLTLNANCLDQGGNPVPVEHDCIQTKDMQSIQLMQPPPANYRFDAVGTYVGGEGVNLKYRFGTKPVCIDANGAIDHSFGSNGHNCNSWAELEGTTQNPSYTNNASPFINLNVGYLRGEIYRFGIVFRNQKGRSSFVKWIGDIKIPDQYETRLNSTETNFRAFYRDTTINGPQGHIMGNILYLTFELKSVPTDAVSWEIVRAPREEWDKTILGQGYWHALIDGTQVLPDIGAYFVGDGMYVVDSNSPLGYVACPEISFGQQIKFEAGLQIQMIGTGAPGHYGYSGGGGGQTDPSYTVYKVYDYTTHVYGYKVNILDAQIVKPGWSAVHIINQTYPVRDYTWVNGVPMGYGPTMLAMCLSMPLGHIFSAYTEEPRLVNIIRGGHIPYGGNTYTARTFSTYISCMQALPITTLTNDVYGGDTYVEMFDYQQTQGDDTATTHQATFEILPVETSINLALRHDRSWSKLIGQNRQNLHEQAGSHGYAPYVFVQAYDMYLYNKAYSRTNNVATFFAKPLNFSDNRIFDARITVSMPKTANEEIDSWTRYLATAFKDVDGSCGPINNLVLFEDKLLFLQDSGLGVVSVNDKVLTVPDETGTALTLGKGGLLDDFQYITRRSGCMHRFAAMVTGVQRDVLYYYDGFNNKIMLYNISGRTYARNETAPLTVIRGIQSLLNESYLPRVPDSTLQNSGVHMEIDPKNGRVMFTFLASATDIPDMTVAFNEYLQTFESFYSYHPQWYQRTGNVLLSQEVDKHQGIFAHNFGDVGRYYGIYNESSITFMVNPMPKLSKVFSNLEYNLNVTLNGADQPERNFDYIRVYNEYQDTGRRALMYGVNSNRRFRVWHVRLPRASVQFLDRIRSQEARIQLVFTNSKNEKFVLEDIDTNYIVKPL